MFYSRMDIHWISGGIEHKKQLLLLLFGLIFSTRSHIKCRTQLPKKSAIGQVVLRQRLRSDGTKRVCRKEVLGNWCLSQMVHHVRKDFNVSRYIQISLPIGCMYAIYMVTFIINIPQTLAYIPYMVPMGYDIIQWRYWYHYDIDYDIPNIIHFQISLRYPKWWSFFSKSNVLW